MVLILLLEVCFPSYNLLFDQLLGGGGLQSVCLSVCSLSQMTFSPPPPALSMC